MRSVLLACSVYEECMMSVKFIRQHLLEIFVRVQKKFGRQHTSASAYTDIPRHTRNVFQRIPHVFQHMSAYAQKVHMFLIRWLYTQCGSALSKRFFLFSGVFTTKELAFSRGLGIGKTKAGDLREPLDSSKITACKGI